MSGVNEEEKEVQNEDDEREPAPAPDEVDVEIPEGSQQYTVYALNDGTKITDKDEIKKELIDVWEATRTTDATDVTDATGTATGLGTGTGTGAGTPADPFDPNAPSSPFFGPNIGLPFSDFGDPDVGGFLKMVGSGIGATVMAVGKGLRAALGATGRGLFGALGLLGKGMRAGFSATMRALSKLKKGRWINKEDYAKLLPQGVDDSNMEFVGGHMGIAAAMTAHWVWHNQARIALYVLALLSLVLLATGLYLYMHDYQLFVQREKDRKNGVYRPEALIAKERKAQEYKVVNYVPLTPPNLAYVTESDRLTNRFYNT